MVCTQRQGTRMQHCAHLHLLQHLKRETRGSVEPCSQQRATAVTHRGHSAEYMRLIDHDTMAQCCILTYYKPLASALYLVRPSCRLVYIYMDLVSWLRGTSTVLGIKPAPRTRCPPTRTAGERRRGCWV